MSENPNQMIRKPDWLKIKLHNGEEYVKVAGLMQDNNLHTICSSGKCPNQAECWNRKTAILMILGDICTRACKFCATKTGKPFPADPDEPLKVARTIKILGMKHCVLTSVDRDDLPDEGANQWAQTILTTRKMNPDTTIEVLIPDFNFKTDLIDTVLAAKPEIVGHNIETVERLTSQVRSRAQYKRSLDVLRYISSHHTKTKSGLMVGLGESAEEVHQTIDDLANCGCSIITIGQYLQPSRTHWPVAEYIHPDVFAQYKKYALSKGIAYVESAPLVRSSYMAEKALENHGK